MPKKRYAFLIAIAVLALALLPTSCACNCSTDGKIPGEGHNPGGFGVRNIILYQTNVNNNKEIYVVNVDGTGQTKLTDGYNPILSPDGKKFVFESSTGQGNIDSLYIMDTSGKNQVTLTDNYRHAGYYLERSAVSWSPDGKNIVFVSAANDHNEDIYIINVDGTGLTRLTDTPEYEATPKWSPDGEKIAFKHEHGLYLINTDGSDQIRLTDRECTSFNWSPDGTKIAYDYGGIIHTINADGSDDTDLTAKYLTDIDIGGYWSNSNPVWSPDGAKIAFESFGRQTSQSAENYDIWVINANGTNPTRLTDNPARDHTPIWSTDSSTITFVLESVGNPNMDNYTFISGTYGTAEIYIMNADGSNQTELTSGYSPVWVP